MRYSYSGRSAAAQTASEAVTSGRSCRHKFPAIITLSRHIVTAAVKLTYPECGIACARDIEVIETSTSGQIAAFMAEPIAERHGGFLTPPRSISKAVAIIRQYGGVFICDEVQTAWGRLGDKWFGIEHWDVEPDIITSAKGIANGSPSVGQSRVRRSLTRSRKRLSRPSAETR